MDKDEIRCNDLSYNNRDKFTMVLKGAFGAIPYAGPMMQELIGVIIPQQRLDRVVMFVEKLSETLEENEIEIEKLKEKLSSPEYSSFVFRTCQNVADSISEEKINYIRNIFINGINNESEELSQYESLMSLLNKINDSEIVYLRTYYLFHWDMEKAKKYQQDTGLAFLTPVKSLGMSQEELDKETIKEIYLNNLVNLGLLIEELKNGHTRYKCSNIGSLLVRNIMSDKE